MRERKRWSVRMFRMPSPAFQTGAEVTTYLISSASDDNAHHGSRGEDDGDDESLGVNRAWTVGVTGEI